MKITRIIALAAMAGIAGTTGIQAQTLRTTSPPAEYPPLSFKGKQFVDSRGCVYIRAGIDGNVTWVPRVTRSRKQICGYAPTKLAGTTQQRPTAPPPELITLDPGDQPAATTAATATAKAPAAATAKTTAPVPKARRPAPTTTAKTAPAAPPRAKPQRTVSTGVAAPATAAATAPAAAAQPAPKRVVRIQRNPAPAAAATVAPAARTTVAPAASGSCAGLSDISRQYSGNAGVRCGPQQAAPVIYNGQRGIGPQSSLVLPPDTRVVQAHIYEQRRLSNSFNVPEGYRPVWKDGRLNPQRAERTLRPAQVVAHSQVPQGYEHVTRDDDRMNPQRGLRSETGDAQMAQVWTNTVPRRLVTLPADQPRYRQPRQIARSPAEAKHAPLRLSTRSAPAGEHQKLTVTQRHYVRAATYSDPAQARAAAQKLAAAGLPARVGRVSRKGTTHMVVLAGPYPQATQARAALARVQGAGFAGAKLSR